MGWVLYWSFMSEKYIPYHVFGLMYVVDACYLRGNSNCAVLSITIWQSDIFVDEVKGDLNIVC